MFKKLLYFTAFILVNSFVYNEAYSFGEKQLRMIPANVCNSNECVYGTCEVRSATTYSCHCVPGVTGTNCNTQAAAGNPCASNPCYSGGVCTNVGTTGFTCSCPAGLGGPTCRGVIGTTCSCQNSGTCTASVFNSQTIQTCSCPTGFAGNLCEYSVSAYVSCFQSGCLNGGTCNILATCDCPTGFSGSTCQLATSVTTTTTSVTNTANLALCFTGICRNGGVCSQISYNIATCTCVNGYTGIFCNVPPVGLTTTTTTTTTTTATTTTLAGTIQACPSTFTFCQNNGTCTLNTVTNAIQCVCLPNFSGPTCATKMPFCNVNPCQNGGTCTTTNTPATGDGTCTCATGFSGTFCDISSCNAATQCNSHGICVQNGATQSCLCFTGFTGPNCT